MAQAIPEGARRLKHRLFSVLPGRIGLRNRACLHHLTKPDATPAFDRALAGLGAGDICIDCGANQGVYTARLSDTGATVHAFEPDPWSYAQLAARFADAPNVTMHNKAAGTRDGSIGFFRNRDFGAAPDAHSLASSTIERPGVAQERIDVPVIDLPAYVRGLDRDVAVLKMDIEGAEVAILEALIETGLIARCRHVFVETHELQYPDLLERTWRLRDRARDFPGVEINLDWH